MPPSPHHRQATGASTKNVGKITDAGRDDDAMRKKCRAGTEAYRLALLKAGYEVGNEIAAEVDGGKAA